MLCEPWAVGPDATMSRPPPLSHLDKEVCRCCAATAGPAGPPYMSMGCAPLHKLSACAGVHAAQSGAISRFVLATAQCRCSELWTQLLEGRAPDGAGAEWHVQVVLRLRCRTSLPVVLGAPRLLTCHLPRSLCTQAHHGGQGTRCARAHQGTATCGLQCGKPRHS